MLISTLIVTTGMLTGFSQKLCGVYLIRFGQDPCLYKFGMTRNLKQRLDHISVTFRDKHPSLCYWTHVDPVYLSVAEKHIKKTLRPFRTPHPESKEMVRISENVMPLVHTLYQYIGLRYSSMEIMD